MGFWDGFLSLGVDRNKVHDPEKADTAEGVVSSLTPELEIKDLKDDEILKLSKEWERKWEKFNQVLSKKQIDVENYWLGIIGTLKGSDTGLADAVRKKPWVDNILFEALETFLPNAASRNPEPVVITEHTDEGNRISSALQKMLTYQADRLVLKLKLKKMLRFWAMYYLGVIKIGWSEIENDIALSVIRPQKLILDPDATIDELGAYTGRYIGEHRKDSADNLVRRFPSKKKYIEDFVHGEMGTEVQYIEWWTEDFTFWKLGTEILEKIKNPHWNYDEERQTLTRYGLPTSETVRGKNHFSHPQMPYTFLSIFNVGKHPVDDTSLMEQNMTNQEMIYKRVKQIDRNADNTNGGVVVSGDHFSKEQAKQAADALRQGNPLWVPTGDVNRAYRRDQGPPLPGFVYQQLLDSRNELRSVFGTRILSNQGPQETTARGKIIARTQELDRIGGGISDYLEQVADRLFNWMVQLMFVYYTDEHKAAILGGEKAAEMVSIQNRMLQNGDRKFVISVQNGSLIPKDSLTKRNEAVDLWTAGALDPITLFERLDFPNPRETAIRLLQWKTNPQALFGQPAQPAALSQPPPAGVPPVLPPGLEQSRQPSILSKVPIQ